MAAALVLLAGCQLLDQRSFHAAAPAKPATQAAHGRRPLVVIGFAVPGDTWRVVLSEAVHAAEARKPDVEFEVATPFPAAAPAAAQDASVAIGTKDAELVARALQEDGVPVERISMTLEGDPGAPAREVRIYVK